MVMRVCDLLGVVQSWLGGDRGGVGMRNRKAELSFCYRMYDNRIGGFFVRLLLILVSDFREEWQVVVVATVTEWKANVSTVLADVL